MRLSYPWYLHIPVKTLKKIQRAYNQSSFYFHIPKAVTCAEWQKQTVVRIGGKINPLLQKGVDRAQKIINVDISDHYINAENRIDIQADAHSLPMLADETADMVASSHTIEHLTNPLKALLEWKRILKTNGVIYASIPYYKKTFDRKRKVTTIEHLIEDYKNNVGLDDKTHDQEFLEHFDVTMDFCFEKHDDWYKNYLTNPSIYTHYHVFDLALVEKLMHEAGFETVKIFYNNISIEYFGIKRT